jgi:hypothetical protein
MGSNRVGASHPLIWGHKLTQLPKRCVLYNTEGLTKPKSQIFRSVARRQKLQNPETIHSTSLNNNKLPHRESNPRPSGLQNSTSNNYATLENSKRGLWYLHHYVQKQSQLLSLLSMNKCIVFLWFGNEGSTAIFSYLYFHQHCLHHYILHLFVQTASVV